MRYADGLGVELGTHMAAIEREIRSKAAEKAHQAQARSTALLIDVRRVGWFWMRSAAQWVPTLEHLVDDPATAFAAIGVFTSRVQRQPRRFYDPKMPSADRSLVQW